MSRPILSRPRTRVYGCNYDKGESYYKPMVDHLDRKYSSRPLFSEPRNSFADEIAARRSDIGSRDLSGPRTSSSARDLDLEFDTPRPRIQSHLGSSSGIHDEDEEMVYDIRGQRTNRRNLADDFASEVSSTTRKFKEHAASLSYDTKNYDELRKSIERNNYDDKFIDAKTSFDEADAAYKRRTKFLSDNDDERNAAITRWTKLPDIEKNLPSSAANRAKQTKARLENLENEMEEMADRQAKRERRSAALRAFVNEHSTNDNDLLQEIVTTKKITKSEKHVTF